MASEDGDLTVVTLNFNQGAFLRRNVESVHGQGRGLHHIVVDPGSTDGSHRLYREPWARHLQVIRQPDSGPPEGLNNGFSHVETTFGAFLNADDYLLPGWADSVLDSLRRGADIAMGSVEMRDESGRLLKVLHPDPPWVRYMLHGINYVTQPGSAFRMSWFRLLGGFNEANRVNWDHELYVRMLVAGATLRRVTQKVAVFTYRSGSFTSSMTRSDEEDRENQRIRRQLDLSELSLPHLAPARRLVARAWNRARAVELAGSMASRKYPA